jgi:hypothetical protein
VLYGVRGGLNHLFFRRKKNFAQNCQNWAKKWRIFLTDFSQPRTFAKNFKRREMKFEILE